MKLLGIIFFLSGLYYLYRSFFINQPGAFYLAALLFCAFAILSYVISNKTKRVWFKRRRLGYGWTPVASEGWFVTGVAVLLMIGIFWITDKNSHSVSDTLMTVFPFWAVILATLVGICDKNSEERVRG